MWSGLKGAVPILLAALAVIGGVDDSGEIYEIVFVVVLFSVLVQGSLVPAVAERLRDSDETSVVRVETAAGLAAEQPAFRIATSRGGGAIRGSRVFS